jgi:hypothetical protein
LIRVEIKLPKNPSPIQMRSMTRRWIRTALNINIWKRLGISIKEFVLLIFEALAASELPTPLRAADQK